MSWQDDLEDFLSDLRGRLDAGEREYGGSVRRRALHELMDELEEELLDQAGWAFWGWYKVQRMKAEMGSGGCMGGLEEGPSDAGGSASP